MNKKVDLHIIGVSTIDEVYSVNTVDRFPEESHTFSSRFTSWGGVGNFVPPLSESKLSVEITTWGTLEFAAKKYSLPKQIIANIRLCSKDNHALILEAPRNSGLVDKTSYVSWGENTDNRKFRQVPAKWTHIAYLDILDKLDLQEIRKNTETLSADLCLTSPDKKTLKRIIKSLKYLDYLFLSTNEYESFCSLTPSEIKNYIIEIPEVILETLKHFKSKTCVIIHGTKWAATVSKELGISNSTNKHVSNKIKHAVGAGDKFCAKFIEHMLCENRTSHFDALAETQKTVVKFLDQYVII